MNNVQKLIVLGSTFVLFAAAPAFAATNDYANYWTFDEGMGRSVNDSVGGQNGVMTGSSTGFGWASGKVNTAIGMDGGAGTGIVLPNSILSGSQGTLSLWLNLQDLTDRNIIFSGKSTLDNNVYAAFMIDRDGRPQFQFRDAATANDRKAQGTKLLNKNEWYNLVFTANAQSYHLYVNGEEATIAGDNIGRWFPDITNHTFMYRIGMLDAYPLSGSFNGYLDDLRIYNRPLTQDEVTALYNEGNTAHPTTPAAVAAQVTLSLSEDHIPFGGSVMLTWSTVHADSCVAGGNWQGAVPPSGSQTFVKLGSDAMYTLTCTNKYGSTESGVKVYVSAEHDSSTSVVNVTNTSKGTLTVEGNMPSQSTSVSTVTTTTSSTKTTSVSSSGESDRRAQIQAMIKQILALIAELQKQLVALKAQGASSSTTHY